MIAVLINGIAIGLIILTVWFFLGGMVKGR